MRQSNVINLVLRVLVVGSLLTASASAQNGDLEICKTSCPLLPVHGLFTFTAAIGGFNSGPLSIPVNACTGAIQGPSGTVTINEGLQLGIDVTAISAFGYNSNGFKQNRLLSDNLPHRSANVTVVPGGSTLETVATFTNCQAPPGKSRTAGNAYRAGSVS